jgi:hypothetical protein
MEAAIFDEYAGKLAAVECCLPKSERAAAIAALLSERTAKLRRFRELQRKALPESACRIITVFDLKQHHMIPKPIRHVTGPKRTFPCGPYHFAL